MGSHVMTITITSRMEDGRLRYHVRSTGIPGSARFSHYGNVSQWVQSARRSAELYGWTVRVDNQTGEAS